MALWSRETDGRYVLHRAAFETRAKGRPPERYGCVRPAASGSAWVVERWLRCGRTIERLEPSRAEAQAMVIAMVADCVFDPPPVSLLDAVLEVEGVDPYDDRGAQVKASTDDCAGMKALGQSINQFLDAMGGMICTAGPRSGAEALRRKRWVMDDAATDLRKALNVASTGSASRVHPVHWRTALLSAAAAVAGSYYHHNLAPLPPEAFARMTPQKRKAVIDGLLNTVRLTVKIHGLN